MFRKTVRIDRENIVETLLNYPADDYKVLLLSRDTLQKSESFPSEWKMSSYLHSFSPSNRIKGILLASSHPAKIDDIRDIMDGSLIEFMLVVTQSSDGIPETAQLHIRKGKDVLKSEYPFFLMEKEFPIAVTDSPENAILIVNRKEQRNFIRESVKLLEDAGYTFVEAEIIKELHSNKKSIDHFISRIEARYDLFSTIVFASEIERNIQAKLEHITKKTIIGREELIISIFQKRATGSSGKLKVAASVIAKEKSVFKNRITGLSRIKGGIGLKGPGETKEEERKRILKLKDKKVRRGLKKEEQRLEFQRKFRNKSTFPTVSIVGYTNAGKSSLFNALLNEHVVEESSNFFSSIDPIIRRLFLFGKSVFLVDTVGLVEGMSKGTVDAFHPTFKEIEDSALILHIIDASDKNWRKKMEFVEELLFKNGVSESRIIRLFSKRELVSLPIQGELSYSVFEKKDIRGIREFIFEKLFASKTEQEKS